MTEARSETALVEINLGIGNTILFMPTLVALAELGLTVDLVNCCSYPTVLSIIPSHLYRFVIPRESVTPELMDCYDHVLADWLPQVVRGYPRARIVPHRKGTESEALWGLSLARELGYEGPLPELDLSPILQTAEPTPETASLLASEKPFVVLHGGCEKEEKTPFRRKLWPDENWKSIAEGLSHRGYEVVFVGTHHDRLGFETSFVDLLGATTLPQTAHLLAEAAFYVGSDSGVGHLAGVLGVKSFLLFGPTNVEKCRPMGVDVTVIETPAECAPCQFTDRFDGCEDYSCMRDITVDMVFEVIDLNTSDNKGNKVCING